MEKLEMLYEGKAKQIFASTNQDQVILRFKDAATAFNGVKKSAIENKGILNNAITTLIFERLGAAGIPTHFIEKLNDREQLCQKVEIIPLEVILRNYTAGSMAKRLGMEESIKLERPVYELCYKNDELGDPLINEDHALALGLATPAELEQLKEMTFKINEELVAFFKSAGIQLADFKIEFGRTKEGNLVLADEISPDSCRLWDLSTGKSLDKDRFRRDLGQVAEAYMEVLERLQNHYQQA